VVFLARKDETDSDSLDDHISGKPTSGYSHEWLRENRLVAALN
jgi:hypothetical protein